MCLAVRRRPAEDGGVGAPPPAGRAERRLQHWTSSLSGFCPRACFRRIAPATCANDLPLETAANRSAPMACGPSACPARGGSGAPPGGPWLARQTPAGCPRQASPAWAIALLGGALAGSGPGTSPCIDGLSLSTGMVVPRALRVQTVRTTMVVPKDYFSRFQDYEMICV